MDLLRTKGRSVRCRIARESASVGLLAACVLLVSVATVQAAREAASSESPEDTLAVVNAEAITSRDLDEMIMGRHRSGNPTEMVNQDLRILLDKAINDRLILQEATAMGLHREEAVIAPVEQKFEQGATKLFVGENFRAPPEITAEEIQRTFDASYWRIQLRQITAATEAETHELRARVRQGESMEELAAEHSTDPRRISGGLHRTKYWADVEDALKDRSRNLELGNLSSVFAYGNGWSFLRVEEKIDADPEDLERFEGKIKGVLTNLAYKAAWKDWVEELQRETPVIISEEALSRLRADQGMLFEARFLKQTDEPALSIDPDHRISEGDLRRSVSHQAMNDGTAAFEVVLQRGVDELSEKLVLRTHAEMHGYLERPELLEQYDRDLEQSMLEVYLEETVASRIRFKREEFQAFYEEHAEEFRKADDVRLSMFVIKDESDAQEAAGRLAGGADFDFVRRQYTAESELGEAKWTSIELFSAEIQEAISPLKVGESSPAIDTVAGWVLIRLDGRRRGPVRPIEEVEMQIRQALFQRKFNELLDEQISLLREHSEIVVYEDRIDRYFTSESR